MSEFDEYKSCVLCPRSCKRDRQNGEKGSCRQTATLRAARAALHMWEEPCISGKNGSGTVFFSGCALHCIFCQNSRIANGDTGKEISLERLAQIFLELQEKGANNINLVTPDHFVPSIVKAIEKAKNQGMFLPVVYNTGSYITVDTLRRLEGLVDIYLPDLKYFDSRISADYANAPDYFDRAGAAIAEMVRQTGKPFFGRGRKPGRNLVDADTYNEKEDSDYLMRQGTIVRHLVLPGHAQDSRQIIRYLCKTFGNQIYLSIMNQYTPTGNFSGFKELGRKVTEEEYESVIDYAISLGIENGFFQEGETAMESFIPSFTCEGI